MQSVHDVTVSTKTVCCYKGGEVRKTFSVHIIFKELILSSNLTVVCGINVNGVARLVVRQLLFC